MSNSVIKSLKPIASLSRISGGDESPNDLVYERRGDSEDIRLTCRPKRCGTESFRLSTQARSLNIYSTSIRCTEEDKPMMYKSQRRSKKSITSQKPLAPLYPIDSIELNRSDSIKEVEQEPDVASAPSIDEIMMARSDDLETNGTEASTRIDDKQETNCTEAPKKKAIDGVVIPKGSYWLKVMSVIRIQSVARSFLVRKNMITVEFERYVRKVVIVQSLYRKKRDAKELEKIKYSIIQDHLRQREQTTKAATVIQKVLHLSFTNKKQREWEKREKEASQEREFSLYLSKYALLLQSFYRGHLARKEAEKNRQTELQKLQNLQNLSAIALQRVCRGHLQRSRFETLVFSAIASQRIYRGYLQRKDLEKQNKSAAALQRVYRGHFQSKRFESIVLSAVVIQRIYRGYEGRTLYVTTREKEVHRKELEAQNKSATTIQRVYKGRFQSKRFESMVLSAILIQRIYRGHRAKTLYEITREQKTRAASIIQSTYWVYICRKTLNMWKSSATVIQRVHRGYVARSILETTLKKIVLIQAITRTFLTRKKISMMHLKATTIQKVYRGDVCRLDLQEREISATLIQSTARKFILRRRMIRNAILIQKFCRSNIAKKYTEKLRNEKNDIEKALSCTLIQSRWRCYNRKWTYLYFLADVITVQSLIRRWKACEDAQQRRNRLETERLVREPKSTVKTVAKMLDAFNFDGSYVKKSFKINTPTDSPVKDQSFDRYTHRKNEASQSKLILPAISHDGEDESKTTCRSLETFGSSSLQMLQAVEFLPHSTTSASINTYSTAHSSSCEHLMVQDFPQSSSTPENSQSGDYIKLHLFQLNNSKDEGDIEVCLDDTLEQNLFSLWGRKAIEVPP